MKKVIAIATDIECSHLYDRVGGDLLSMAFVEVLEDYTLGKSISLLSRATNNKYFDPATKDVHGFSVWDACKFPERRESIDKALEWLSPYQDIYPIKLLYYASGNFDWNWLSAHFQKEDKRHDFSKIFPHDKTESVLKLARENLKHIEKSKKINKLTGEFYTDYSLVNVSDHYGIELDHHEALSDALACAQIWCNIQKKEDTWTGKLL